MTEPIDTDAIRGRIFWGRAVKPEQANTPAILDEFEQVLDAYDALAENLEWIRVQISNMEADAIGVNFKKRLLDRLSD